MFSKLTSWDNLGYVARFLLNSAFSALFYTGCVYLFEKTGRASLDTNLALYSMATILNFLGSKYFVYRSNAFIGKELAGFLVLVILGIVFNTIVVKSLTQQIHQNYTVSALVALVLWSALSFLAQKLVVFSTKW